MQIEKVAHKREPFMAAPAPSKSIRFSTELNEVNVNDTLEIPSKLSVYVKKFRDACNE